MKRIWKHGLPMMLSGVLALSLAACGSQSGNAGAAQSAASGASSAADTSASAPEETTEIGRAHV